MVTKILVPIDGSNLADHAVLCAKRLARATGATLDLVPVLGIQPPYPLFVEEPLYYDDFDMCDCQETSAGTASGRLKRPPLDLNAMARVIAERSAQALLEFARQAGIDLVVMCDQACDGTDSPAGTALADRLVRRGAAPVLLVGRFGAPINPSEVVVALDGSAGADAVLGMLKQLAPWVLTGVTLLRVVRHGEDGLNAKYHLREVARRLEAIGLPCRSRLVWGDLVQAIVDAAGVERLVVMAASGHAFPCRWATGAVADHAIHGGVAGVLLVREEPRTVPAPS